MSEQNQTRIGRRHFTLGLAGAVAGVGQLASGAETATTQPSAGPDEFLLKDRVAVITGAARGIGRAIAVELARHGADIVAIDIAASPSKIIEYEPATPEDLEETGKQVQSTGRRYLSIVADQRDIGALRKAADQVMQQFGRLDIVIADAAIQVFKPLIEMEDAHWHDVIDINLNGTANVIRVFAPILIKQGRGGRIMTLSSMQGRHGTKNASSYSASKWGIIGLTKSVAMELGQHKITVNAIIPGLVDTKLTHYWRRWSELIAETTGKAPDKEHTTQQEAAGLRTPRVPMHVPWLTAEQIAPVAVFLASDAAAMVTGTCYDVTGGDSAHDMD